ncbi:Parvalbumin [Trema orientale]|uniref:Parvalbumin n=1 Tax=Trema orientale TaxID=63057 RepID=A0A2P5FWH7_TREOI|nr:Parvalbumin [Trema orientale]
MEEIRETALAYYANLSDKRKKKAKSLFNKMDSNGDGRVTLSEYENNFKKLGLSCDIPRNSSLFKEIFQEKKMSFFKELDKDEDGTLDFEDFITLYYLLRTGRLLFCSGHECQVFLKGLFFSCPKCFKKPKKTITLCSTCFSEKKYSHKRSHVLLDNYAFLMSTQAQKSKVTTLDVLDFGVNVIGVASSCTIM